MSESITPLIIASYNGFVSICRILITIGHADVNQQDNTQKSALLLASYAGHIDVMAELIEHGASLNTLDQYGWSSLMLAAYAGKLEACKLLLAQGADPHIKTANGKNARSLSWDAGHKYISVYISKFLTRANNGSSSSTGPGSSMSPRTLIPQMLPQVTRSPSRKTHSPAPSLPSVPEEGIEEGHIGTQRSFSAQNSTISRQSMLSPRINARRPLPIVATPVSTMRLGEEEPVSPIPTAVASGRLSTIFNSPNESDINSLEDCGQNEVSSASASELASASQACDRSGIVPTMLPMEASATNAPENDKQTQRASAIQAMKPTQIYKIIRRRIVPRYGSRQLHFSPEDQPETAIPHVRIQGPSCNSLSERIKETDMEDSLNRRVLRQQQSTEQSRNRTWTFLSLIVSCCCPAKVFPRTWSKDRRQNWREKLTLGVMVAGLSLAFGLLILGLPLITCRPRSIHNVSLSGFAKLYGNSSQGVDSGQLMAIRGSVYNVGSIFLDGRHPSAAGSNTQGSLNSFVDAHFGADISYLFVPMELVNTCDLFGAASNFGKCSPSSVNHCHQMQTSQYLLQNIIRRDIRIAFRWIDIQDMTSQGRSIFVYDGSVFEVTDYLAQAANTSITVAEKTRMDWIRGLVGKDATLMVQRQADRKNLSNCFQGFFKLGELSGQTTGCITSIVIDILTLSILMLITTMRLASALVYQWIFSKPLPESGKGSSDLAPSTEANSESHVLMLVTCRADDTKDHIKATLDALALSDYDDNRKLLMVITDATVDSIGNLGRASQSCLNLMDSLSTSESEKRKELGVNLGPEPDTDPIPIDGIQRSNDEPTLDDMKIHSGHYTVDSRRVPYILIIRPSRHFSQTNNGDWQKKRLVIRWLYRICFNKPMSAFEFTLFEKVRTLNRHGPGLFDLLLTTKVGSMCGQQTIRHMVDALEHNERVLGVSGHCLINNGTQNWVTRIQDYENHLSMQFSSTFESMLGAIQCLPSQLSLIRIKIKRPVEYQSSNKKLSKRPSGDASVISSSDDEGDDNEYGPRGGNGMVAKPRKSVDSGQFQYCIPILVHPEVVSSFVGHKTRTTHEQAVVQDEGESRYLTGLLHKSFPDRRVMYLPHATYSIAATSDFWAYIEGQRRIMISSFHSVWIQIWSQDLRGIFCCSINFLAFLEWIYLVLLPAVVVMSWIVVVVLVVGSVTDVGALYSLPTVLALVLLLSVTVPQPVMGICLGRRSFMLNLVGVCLLLITTPFKCLTIAVYAYRLYEPDSSTLEDSEPSTIQPLQEVVTRSASHRTLRHWAEWSLMSRMDQEQTLEQQKLKKHDTLKQKWTEVFEDPNLNLESLKARAISQDSNLGRDGIRSVCWKVYLSCLPSLEISTWRFAMEKERESYVELRKKYIRAIGGDEGPEPDLEVNNPLSLAEDSPWQQFFVDTELRKIIKQDVDRTLPDNDYFRSEKVQEQLNDILFIYCKINHDVSYRQGMHELVAYILWVVSSESLDINSEPEIKSDLSLEVMKTVLDSNYIEHDTFALFSSLMSRAKPWYEFSDEGGASRRPKPNMNSNTLPFGRSETPEPPAGKQTPVIEWSMKIFHYLERVDNELFLHLKSLEIQPQLFGIRWFRLLFGREFPMEDALILWDGIFAKDPSLNICIFIGLALLLRIKDDLLQEDFAGCLHKLMRYPPVKDVQLFISQALSLQRMPNAAGGQEVIRQNYALAGKPLPALPPLGADADQGSHNHQQQYKRDGSSSPYTRQSNQLHYNQPGHNDQSKSQILSFPGNGGFAQHLPPAALDAIKPVAEGFVHATKNVLESKGGAALNKAINDMKKNTQSYIRKVNAPVPATPSSSFPPMLDQVISSSGRVTPSSQPVHHPPKHQGASNNDTNSSSSNNNSSGSVGHSPDNQFQVQLGQIVAKALAILEAEFVSPANSDDSSKVKGKDETNEVRAPSKAALAAISGLEHVRDVLLGSTRDVDPLVIESGMLESSAIAATSHINTRDAAQSGTKIAPSPLNPSSNSQTLGTSPVSQRKPINAVAVTAKTISPSSTIISSSPVRSSIEIPRDARTPSRTSNYTTGAAAISSEHEHPVTERYVPTPPPPVPTPKPFSFDDLIEDTIPTTARSTSPLPGSKGAGSSALASKVKSPRSSLANSQFSWMLSDEGTATSTGSTAATSFSTHSPVSKSDLFSSSIASPSHRVKIDPLAGSISKPGGSGMPVTGSGLTSISNQQLQEDDPLRL
ncbi:TBC1 domain, member 5 [Entomortierella chlamydospora]|nr:TBC1 domain, member 5 [Entomortierella chlamydospora]